MSYDPRNINQMYEQYSKTHSSKPVKFNKSPLDDDTSSSFDQFTRRETTRGLGSPTKPDDDDKQEDTGGVKGFFSRMFNLLDTSGAKKSTPIDYEGSSVYNRKEFNIKPTPVSVSELDDAPQGYDPLGINTRDFGKGVDTFNTDTDPKIPETAMIDIGNPNKEDVNRGTPSRLAKAAAVSAGLMTPALPGMADAVNRTLSSLRMDSTEVPYVIQAGDTLSDIAAKTGTTVNDLVKANNIENKNKIYTGEELVIPTERTTMTKDDVVSAIIRGYERDKDMSGVQMASSGEITSDGFYDPESEYIESFRQGITPIEMMRTTGDDEYVNADYMSELEILARTIQAEAGGESKKGKLAVGSVIKNRADQNRFGNDIRSVILFPSQFSPWNKYTSSAGGRQGKDMLGAEMKPSKASYEAAEKILSGKYIDPTGGATHFVNPKEKEDVSWYKPFVDNKPMRIGNHEFGSPDNPNWQYSSGIDKSIRPKVRPKGLGAK